jgi:hypothetical protein
MQEAAVVREMPLLDTATVYTRFGDIFSGSCLAVSILIGAWEVLRHRRGGFKI